MSVPFDIESFLAEPLRPAQVASVSPTGTPILGSFWFLFAEARFWFSSQPQTPLVRAVTNGAEAAVIVDEFSPPEKIQQVRVRGHGRLEPHDPERVEQMYRRYLGDHLTEWPAIFRRRPKDPAWSLWTVTPRSGVVVAYPHFTEHKLRWRDESDSPLAPASTDGSVLA
jgi:hypothetical protein